jgi:hypothetical protein
MITEILIHALLRQVSARRRWCAAAENEKTPETK